MPYANSEGPDGRAHPCSLLWTFSVPRYILTFCKDAMKVMISLCELLKDLFLFVGHHMKLENRKRKSKTCMPDPPYLAVSSFVHSLDLKYK